MNPPQLRLGRLTLLLLAFMAALSVRLFEVIRHDELRATAVDNTQRTIVREPLRGQILDIRLNPLATSVPVKVVCADPSLISSVKDRTNVAHALTVALEGCETNYVVESNILQRLMPKIRADNRTNRYVVIRRKVTLDKWDAVHKAMTNLTFDVGGKKLTKVQTRYYNQIRDSAVFAQDDQLRIYYGKKLASHVIGYVGYIIQSNSVRIASVGTNTVNAPLVDASTGKPVAPGSTNRIERVALETGLNGIELTFNKQLTGIRGWRRTEMAKKQELFAYRDQDVQPHNGANVVLTIDIGLQDIVESELQAGLSNNLPLSISCIMMRPRTGEILAMATLPNFDPNDPSRGIDPKDPAKVGFEALKNRVICNIIEPGSTFKIVPVSGALNEHAVSLNDVFDCEHGAFHFEGKILHDHDRNGPLSVADIIKKSSNIGAAKIGIRLGEEKLYDYICRYGFGVKTGIPLPGEVPGLVRPPRKWSKVSIAQIPMGQGIAVTPLQMAMAMGAIANHGVLMRPMIVDRLVDQDGKLMVQYKPQAVRRVISEEAARQMVTALKTVPTKDGTAEAAKMEHFTVAGKTGTSNKNTNGVYIQKYFSSFIGFLPADNPEVLIMVLLDDPRQNGHYGGKVAGPVFKAIAERTVSYLNLKPDIQPELEPEISNSTLATIPVPPGAARPTVAKPKRPKN
jgi:cell division protein FtsI/penicillin-binding protein 2